VSRRAACRPRSGERCRHGGTDRRSDPEKKEKALEFSGRSCSVGIICRDGLESVPALVRLCSRVGNRNLQQARLSNSFCQRVQSRSVRSGRLLLHFWLTAELVGSTTGASSSKSAGTVRHGAVHYGPGEQAAAGTGFSGTLLRIIYGNS